MSRRKSNDDAQSVSDRVRKTAAVVKPRAVSTQAAAKRNIHRLRAWAGPRVERTGQVLQDNVTPKVSAMLSAAGKRLEPAKQRSPRWRKLTGISLSATAAGSAIAAFIRQRIKSGNANSQAGPEPEDTVPAEKWPAEPTRTKSESDADRQVRTS